MYLKKRNASGGRDNTKRHPCSAIQASRFSMWHKYFKIPFTYHSKAVTKLFLNREVNVDDLKTAFRAINPNIDDQTLDTYVGLAFQVQREGPAQEVVPMETALERLLAGDVRRVGPLHREEGTTGVEGE